MRFVPVWRATLTVRPGSASEADRLASALGPEVDREVPRARSSLERPDRERVRLAIATRDTGALRAALNTYLGWIALAGATEAVAAPSAGPRRDPDGLGAKRF